MVPDHFMAAGTDHPNISCFNHITSVISVVCATVHTGKGTQIKHYLVWRGDATYSSPPFASTALPVPSSPANSPDLGLMPSMVSSSLQGGPDAQGSGCSWHFPAALLLAGATGSLPCPAERTVTITSSTQAATNSRVQEMGWPQISILKRKKMVKIWAINQKRLFL